MITKFNFQFLRAGLALAALAAATVLSFTLPQQTARMQSQNVAPRIAYDDRNQHIHAINADGSADTSLADGFDPSYSQDGARVAYAYGSDPYLSEIFVMDADGANQTQITENGLSYSPAFSPAGNKIVFVSEYEGGAHIYTINADGTAQQRVFFAGDFTGEHAPEYSSDGAKIVFVGTTLVNGSTNDDYYLANADGTGAPLHLTFNVKNNGDAAATNVKVSSTALIAGEINRATYVSASAAGGCTLVLGNATVECLAGTLQPNQTAVVQIVVKPNYAGNMLFNASASATERDRNESDNTNFANVLVGAAPACAANVTNKVRVLKLSAVRNPRTGEYEQILFAQNVSGQNLHPRAMFVFDNLTQGVSIADRFNPGVTQCAAPVGSQYVVAATNGAAWKPNQIITVHLAFRNAARKNINYNLRVMAGANNP